MSIGLKKNFAVFALSALAAGAVAIACGGGGGGGSNGGAGGDSGGAGGDGGGGGNGGAATGGKGSGGNGNGGSGNGGSGNGGSGGSSNGGSGGMPMTGGMGMGGAGGMLMTGALPWCNSTTAKPAVNDGVVEGLTAAGEPFDANAPVGEIKAIGSSMVFVPAQYAAAPDGKVGLVIVLPSYSLTDEKKRLEQAINAKHFPPVIVATSTRGSALALIDTLQGMFPKIPKDPKWVALAGQSTAGAEAFDLVWDNPGKAANAITASGSFVCFMGSQQDQNSQNNALYVQRIGAAAKKPIRASLSVGTCDVFGSLGERAASDCANKTCSRGECVDASACGANWQKVNRDVAGALQAKGYGYQLQIMTKGAHQTPASPSFINQIRWVFKPIMCS